MAKPGYKECPFCAEEIKEKAIKCRYCGSMFAEAQTIKTPSVPDEKKEDKAERRYVGVMFADISGFTALSEKLDPETVRELMNSCFESFTSVVKRYEGTVDKYIGDAIMALFGAPVAHEDDPQRAVITALEMKKNLKEFNQKNKDKLPAPLNMTIGISYGLVVAGDVGTEQKRDYTVMGDTVNLASRLQSKASAGQILVDESIHRYTGKNFDFNPIGAINIKGKEKPVPVYELLGKKTIIAESGKRVVGEFYAPLAGRDKQMRVLLDSAGKCLEGKEQIIFIKGKAGIGKTRLIEEIIKEVGEGFQILVLRGRRFSYEEAQSSQPFLIMLRSFFQLQMADNRGQYEEKVKKYLKDLGEGCELLAPSLISFLSQQTEIPETEKDAETKRADPIKIIGGLISAIVRKHPLLLVVDDLHWADRDTLQLLNLLPESLHAQKIMIVLTFREHEIKEKVEKLKLIQHMCERWSKHRELDFMEMKLDELSKAASAELTRSFIPIENLPEVWVSKIVDRSQGNPMFIIQMINALIDQGAIVHKDKTWEVVDKSAAIPLPKKVSDLILSRADGLGNEHKSVLQRASVIGMNFKFSVLKRLTEIPEERLKSILIKLEKMGFIIRGEEEYQFIHALNRETFYNSMLLKTRKALHEKLARAMEEEQIAKLRIRQADKFLSHLQRAEDTGKSIPYLLEMGRKALKMRLKEQAKQCYQSACDLIKDDTDPDLKFETFLETGKIYLQSGNYDKSFQYKNEAMKIADSLQDKEKRIKALLESGRIHYYRSNRKADIDMKNARKIFLESAEMSEKEGFKNLAAEGYYHLARVIYLEEGNKYREDGILEAEKAIALARESKNYLFLGKALRFRAYYYINLNQWDEALPLLAHALKTSERFDNPRLLVKILSDLARVHNELGHEKEYEDYSIQSVEVAKKSGSPFIINTAYKKWAGIEAKKGSAPKAIKLYKECIKTVFPFQEPGAISQVNKNIANLYIKEKKFDKALKLAKEAYRYDKESGSKHYLSSVCTILGKIYLAMQNFEKAIPVLKEGLSASLDSPLYACCVFNALAKAYKDKGDEEKSWEVYERAWQYCQEQNYNPTGPAIGLLKSFIDLAGRKGDTNLAQLLYHEWQERSSELGESTSEGFGKGNEFHPNFERYEPGQEKEGLFKKIFKSFAKPMVCKSFKGTNLIDRSSQ